MRKTVAEINVLFVISVYQTMQMFSIYSSTCDLLVLRFPSYRRHRLVSAERLRL